MGFLGALNQFNLVAFLIYIVMVAIEFITTLVILGPQIFRALQVVHRQRIYNLTKGYVLYWQKLSSFEDRKLVSSCLLTR